MDFCFIKKEEPVDYALVSTEDKQWIEEDTVAVPNDFNSVDVFTISVKEETTSDLNDNIDSTHATTDSETSEYDPQHENSDDDSLSEENDKVEEWTGRSKNSSRSKLEKPFACNKCNAVFSRKLSLKEHLIKHQKLSDMDACPICNKFFPKSSLELHIMLHSGPPFRCAKCTKTFECRGSFRHHRIVHEEKKYECDICHKCFRHKGTILTHLETHGEREKTFRCETCNSCFIRRSSLRRHIRHFHSDVPRKKLKCPNPLCNREYFRSSCLARHKCVIKTIHSCPICNKKFSTKNGLRCHIRPEERCTKPKIWHCDKCKQMFRNLYCLILHTLQNCAKKITYECDTCSKILTNKRRLVEHFGFVHKIRELSTISCSNHLCKQKFVSKRQMELHVKKRHTKKPTLIENCTYECEYCCQTFQRKCSYKVHKNKSVNWGCIPQKLIAKYSDSLTDADDLFNRKSQQFKCDICGCAFERKFDIIEHMTILHSTQSARKKFNCSICKKVLSQYQCSNVDHVGDKFRKCLTKTEKCKFKCKKCRINFSELYALMKHSSRHSDKVHNCFQHMQLCKKCNQKFNWKFPIAEHLRTEETGKHLRTLKAGNGYKCEFCKKMFKYERCYITHFKKCTLT